MATTKSEIRGWLERAKKDGCCYVLVVEDTFDHSDYPVFIVAPSDLPVQLHTHSMNMQKVRECYSMAIDLEKQLAERRAWHTGEKTN